MADGYSVLAGLEGEALYLDFTTGRVTTISLAEANRRMREQEERGVRFSFGNTGPGSEDE